MTIRFEDAEQPGVIAMTVAVLRPELFRIVVESPGVPGPAGSPEGAPGRWAHAVEGGDA